MKKTMLICCLLLMIGCESKKAVVEPVVIEYTKASLSEIDANQKSKAYDLGKRILMICNTSKFIPFTKTEATASVMQNTTLEKHSRICQKFILRYGSFKDIKLMEVYKMSPTNELLFRYKAIYERTNANKELRVTLNNENLVSSVRTQEWQDNFQNK